MDISIESVADLGLAVRAVRRGSKVWLDDLATLAGVSKQFTSDLEYGKATVQMGLVFKLLEELGLKLHVNIPEAAADAFAALKQQGGLRKKPARAGRSVTGTA